MPFANQEASRQRVFLGDDLPTSQRHGKAHQTAQLEAVTERSIQHLGDLCGREDRISTLVRYHHL